MMQACNPLLTLTQKEIPVTYLRHDFSTGEFSWKLTVPFNSNCVPSMLEGEDYQRVDMVFPIIFEFVGKVTEYSSVVELTNDSLYSDLVVETYGRR